MGEGGGGDGDRADGRCVQSSRAVLDVGARREERTATDVRWTSRPTAAGNGRDRAGGAPDRTTVEWAVLTQEAAESHRLLRRDPQTLISMPSDAEALPKHTFRRPGEQRPCSRPRRDRDVERSRDARAGEANRLRQRGKNGRRCRIVVRIWDERPLAATGVTIDKTSRNAGDLANRRPAPSCLGASLARPPIPSVCDTTPASRRRTNT